MTIYKIIQSQDGHIWLGTNNGLCRYDGVEFTTYNSPLLKGNEILEVIEGTPNTIYFTNLEGQLAYLKDDQIRLYKHEEFVDTANVFDCKVFDNKLWIYINHSAQFYCYTYDLDKEGKPSNRRSYDRYIRSAILYKKEPVLMSRSPSDYQYLDLLAYNSKGGELDPYPEQFDLPLGYLRGVENYLDERLLIHNEHILFSLKDNQTTKLINTDKIINGIKVVDSTIWILTKTGIFLLNPGQQKAPELILNGVYANTAMKDRENNMWIGTTENGLLIIPSQSFQVYTPENSALADKRITCFHKNPRTSQLLVGHSNRFLTVIDQQQDFFNVKLPRWSMKINDITTDEKNRIYLAQDIGIQALNKDFSPINIWNANSNKQLFLDSKGYFILPNSSSVTRVPKSFVLQKIAPPNSNIKPKHVLIHKRSYAALEDYSGRYWLGTTQGIYIHKDSITRPFLEDGQHPFYSVKDMLQVQDSTIWIGTQSDGLLGIKNKKVIARYSEDNGLVSNKCNELYVDDDNVLWIGTNKGINTLDLKSKTIGLINTLDGLPSNEINAIYIEDDKAWIGTPKGLAIFPKSAIHLNTIPPIISFTNLKIWEKDTVIQANYELDHRQNNLFIGFKGIAMRARGGISYRYRMLGIDTNWVTTNTQFVRYPALNPGQYQFEVVALNEDLQASEAPAVMQFYISTPWWQTLWFKLLIIAMVMAITALIFYLRLRNIRRKEKEQLAFQEKVNELRMQALQVQMNPHFVFNALNAIQKYLTTNEQEQAMIYLARFARLIRLIFEQSKKKEISLEEELDFLNLYLDLEKLRFKDKINIKIDVDPELVAISDSISIPPLLIQPAIENAFKHGLLHKKEKGILSLQFTKQSDHLLCIVEDNGVGRKKANQFNEWRPKEYESSGLKTTQERLAIFNDKHFLEKEITSLKIIDLMDEAGDASGTRVEIRVICPF